LTIPARGRTLRIVRLAAGLLLSVALGGCAFVGPPASPLIWGDRVPDAPPDEVAKQPVVSRTANSITLLPISPPGAVVGQPYGYDMPHCGIHSPIDVDGSFWDAVDIDPDSVEFDGQPGIFRLVSHDAAEFTGSSGASVLHLVRHVGAKAFGMCA
jgi:hypothetical protein